VPVAEDRTAEHVIERDHIDDIDVRAEHEQSSRQRRDRPHGDSGVAITTAQIGTAAAVYVARACTGALFFGQLTDRFGRKKLFLLTLGLSILATLATAASWTAWFFFLCRVLTGAGST
jgi:MFS family permease